MSTIDASAALWSADEGERSGKPLVVLLHGVGSFEGDLIGLVPALSPDFVYASLRAPGTYGGGWSWYPLTLPGAPRYDDVDEGAAAVLAWLDGLASVHPSVTLLGFSQGGSLALQLLRLAPTRFAAALVLSGFVAPIEGATRDAAAADSALAAAQVPVFYGIGDADPIITPDAVARTDAWLATHASAEVHVYAGMAHSISQEELDDVNAFVARVVG